MRPYCVVHANNSTLRTQAFNGLFGEGNPVEVKVTSCFWQLRHIEQDKLKPGTELKVNLNVWELKFLHYMTPCLCCEICAVSTSRSVIFIQPGLDLKKVIVKTLCVL